MDTSQITALHVDGSLLFQVYEHHEEPGMATLVLIGQLDQDSEDLLTAALARTWHTWPVAVTIDLQGVKDRKQARSKYGAKRPKKA